MIDEIQVENLALIRQASLSPSPGLTVLTGETGAGKTALLSALKLLIGSRASADMVRDGEKSLVVSGRFFGQPVRARANGVHEPGEPGQSHVANRLNREDAPDGSDDPDSLDELVVTRRVGMDGRSRASIDGSMVSARELAETIAPSVDLCGQFEHQRLMTTANHVVMFDAWAGERVAQAHAAYEQALTKANGAASELARIRDAADLSSAKLDEARFTLRRIDEVRPQSGEYEDLKRELQLVEHAEALANAAEGAYESLSGESGALDGLNAAASALENAGGFDANLLPLAQSLREAGYVLEDVAAEVRDYRDRVDFDPSELARQQERFSQFQGLLRSFGPRMEDVFARYDAAAETVSLVDDSEARTKAAEKELAQAEAALVQAADALDEAREKAAPQFAQKVTEVMARLEMGGAGLVCQQTRLPREGWTGAGPSKFEFLYRPGEGLSARSLARIASGGEVSRVMLACKVFLGANDDVDTLVFDEVDAGVGGAVAVALAACIAELAQTHQVIVVTHLAQVAVRGDAHYVVTRGNGDSGAETHLAPVTGDAREREVARMLSGSITDASLAHARELLGEAQKASGKAK